MEIAVPDAAERLGVSEPRVRQLLASGDLAGRRLGRSWLVSAESVARLQQNRRLPGRPLGPRRAWGLLDILAGGEAAWLTSSARSQLKASMRRLAGADADEWRAALRGRSQVLACQAHPAAIPRLLSHQRVLPAGLAVHLVCDNYATRNTAEIKTWLARHPRFHVHFTPTGSSWMNQVERWFGLLTDKLIRRGVHTSVQALENDIKDWIATWNDNPRPFTWTKTADEILNSLADYLAKLRTGHPAKEQE